MKTPEFLRHKISRQLNTHGLMYNFTLMKEDEYHQPTEDSSIEIRGVYHEVNSFITVASSNAASVQRKKSPMILTLLDDSVKRIKQGDRVTINSTRYTVSGVLDIQNYGVAADISLEMEV